MNGAYFVDTDASQETVDVAVHPGTAEAVKRLRAPEPTLIVLEARGGHEVLVVGALVAVGLHVVVTNPRQVRDVARATG